MKREKGFAELGVGGILRLASRMRSAALAADEGWSCWREYFCSFPRDDGGAHGGGGLLQLGGGFVRLGGVLGIWVSVYINGESLNSRAERPTFQTVQFPLGR